MDEVITITGIPRSGSTLVFQICRQIIADGLSARYKHKTNGIFRTHGYVVPGSTFNKNIILCIRDPRDAILSYSKLRNEENYPLKMEQWFKYIKETISMYQNSGIDGYHVFRYEFFHPNNLMEMYKTICEIMEAEQDVEYGRFLLEEKFSLQNAKRVSAELQNFDKYDKDMIHGMHVTNDGKIGGWKNELDSVLLERVIPYVKELGYEY